MNRFNSIKTGVSFYIITLLAFGSCTKEQHLGIESDSEKWPSQTLTMRTETIKMKPVITDNRYMRTDKMVVNQYKLLGNYTEAVFGSMVADLYTELAMPNDKFSFSPNLIIDSVILALPYLANEIEKTYYGDGAARFTAQVWRLIEELKPKDKLLRSDESFITEQTDLVTTTTPPSSPFAVNPKTEVSIGGNPVKKVAGHLRIPLKKDEFKRILSTNASAGNFTDQKAFNAYFKGLKVKIAPTTGKGGFIKLNTLSSELAGLFVYYKKVATESRTEVARFKLTDKTNSLQSNYFKPNFTQEITDDLGKPSKDKLYIMGLAGLETKIQFPAGALQKLAEKKPVIIRQAKLILTVSDAKTDINSLPAALVINRGVDVNGNYVLLPEKDRAYAALNQTDKTYTFYIPRHATNLANGLVTDQHLYISLPTPSTNPARVVLKGGADVKCNLTYSLE